MVDPICIFSICSAMIFHTVLMIPLICLSMMYLVLFYACVLLDVVLDVDVSDRVVLALCTMYAL